MENNKEMKVQQFEIEFKRNINAQRTINADGILRQVAEELNPTKDDSDRTSYAEQVTNLENGLAKEGVYPFAVMYDLKKRYVMKRATNEGAYPKALQHYGRVFDTVVNKALYNKAVTLSKVEAKEFDEYKKDLNEQFGTFFAPVERVGSEWLPVAMEDIAFIDDDQAGEWEIGQEPYAGTSFLDTI